MVRAVMAHLGHRNAGKRQRVTAAGVRQRRAAGKASGRARRAAARRAPAPAAAHKATSTKPLAQTTLKPSAPERDSMECDAEGH